MNLLNPAKSRLQPRLVMAHRCARRGIGGIVLVAFLLGGVPPAALASPAVLVIEQGTVSIKRDSWFRRFHRARNGAHLGDTDLIRPTQNARALLRCPDETSLTPIPAGTTSSVNSLCNNTRVRYRPQDLAIGDLQGGSDPTLPYVITPRTRTWFGKSRPTKLRLSILETRRFNLAGFIRLWWRRIRGDPQPMRGCRG